MKVKALYGIGFLVVNMLLSGCTYTVYLPDDEDKKREEKRQGCSC